MENKELEKEIRTIIPILARRCGVFNDDVLEMMWKVCNEEKITNPNRECSMTKEEAIQEAKVFILYCEEYWDEMVHHISEKQLEAIKYLIENEQ